MNKVIDWGKVIVSYDKLTRASLRVLAELSYDDSLSFGDLKVVCRLSERGVSKVIAALKRVGFIRSCGYNSGYELNYNLIPMIDLVDNLQHKSAVKEETVDNLRHKSAVIDESYPQLRHKSAVKVDKSMYMNHHDDDIYIVNDNSIGNQESKTCDEMLNFLGTAEEESSCFLRTTEDMIERKRMLAEMALR